MLSINYTTKLIHTTQLNVKGIHTGIESGNNLLHASFNQSRTLEGS